MNWFVYAILPPILNALDSLGEKFLLEKRIRNEITIVLNEGFIFFLVGIITFTFQRIPLLPISEIIVLLLSGAVFIYYLIPYLKALSMEETSRIIPLFQLIPLFTLVMSYFFLGERITLSQFIGFLLILFGALLISGENLNILKPKKSFWYMVLSTFLYACSPILFKFVVVKTNFWTGFFYQAMGGALGSLSLLLYPPYRKSFFEENIKLSFSTWIVLSANQTLAIGAEFFGSLAVSLAPVALVEIVTGTQPLFTLLFAIGLSLWLPKILKEDISHSTLLAKFISIFLIIGGLVCIYL